MGLEEANLLSLAFPKSSSDHGCVMSVLLCFALQFHIHSVASNGAGAYRDLLPFLLFFFLIIPFTYQLLYFWFLCLVCSNRELVQLLGGAVAGLHSMIDEHFGISVVEYMAAGAIPIGECVMISSFETSLSPFIKN